MFVDIARRRHCRSHRKRRTSCDDIAGRHVAQTRRGHRRRRVVRARPRWLRGFERPQKLYWSGLCAASTLGLRLRAACLRTRLASLAARGGNCRAHVFRADRHRDSRLARRCLPSGLERGREFDRRLRCMGDRLRRRLGRLSFGLWHGRGLGRRRRRGMHRRWWCRFDCRWRRRAWRRRWLWWGRRSTRREQRERIHISLRIACDPDAEVDIRDLVLWRPARPDRSDSGPFPNGVALPDGERAQLHERHRVAVVGLDSDDLSVRDDRTGERDVARSRREDGGPLLAGNVDPAMLAARVRIPAEDERLEHFSRGRPRPPVGGGR